MSFSLEAFFMLAQIIQFVSILFIISNSFDRFFALNLHVISLLFSEFFNFKNVAFRSAAV